MIKTSRQLKDLIRNMAKGDSGKSQLLIRNYAMERFLERIALSKYKNNFILKWWYACFCYGRIREQIDNGY